MRTSDQLLQSQITTALVWLMMATSSIVFIEPALYDLLGLGLIIVLVALGLRLPAGIGLPMCLLTLYLIANIVSAAINTPVDSLRSVWVRSIMVFNWLMFASIIYHMPVRFFQIIWHGYVVAGCIAVLIGLCAFLNLHPLFSFAIQYDRVMGTFKDPNVFGPFMIPPLLYLLTQIEKYSLLKASLLAATALFLATGIYLSFSRGAWMATAVSIFLYGAIRYHIERSAKMRTRLLTVLVAVCILGTLVPILSKFSEDAAGTFDNRISVAAQSYDARRFSAQRLVVAMAPTNPFGIGPAQSGNVLQVGLEPHNIYLHVLLEAGWLGAAAFYSFLVLTMTLGFSCCFKRSETQTNAIIVFSSLAGILVQSLFIDSTHWRHFFLLLGLLWGLILYSQHKEPT